MCNVYVSTGRVCRFCSHPVFLEKREVCPFLWWLVPHKENVQPVQWSHSLPPKGSGRMCSSALYGPNMDHGLLAKPETLDDGASSLTFSQACWSKPISLNQYMGTQVLAQAHGYFLASRNIEIPLIYLWLCALSPMAGQGCLWRSTFLKVQILNFRALSLSSNWLTHAIPHHAYYPVINPFHFAFPYPLSKKISLFYL